MKMKYMLLPISMFAMLLSSCGDLGVVPVAYTRFVSSGTQYVYYTSYVYRTGYYHIVVWKDKAESERQFSSPDITFSFGKTCGADDVEDLRYMLVDLSYKPLDMQVNISKSAAIYSASKKIYLNGVALTPTSTYGEESDPLVIWTFDNPAFVRTNPNGQMDYTKLNTLEYK